MNTPAHLLIGAGVFATPHRAAVNTAALLGSVLPDLSLYLLSGWALIVQRIPAQQVFDTLYFSPGWQNVFAIDNSFVLWAAGLAAGAALKARWAIALCGAALLHLIGDFLLHHGDARRHFWPLSDWVFVSPVSYWDPRHFGHIVGPLEGALCLLICVLLWRRFHGAAARCCVALAAVAALAPGFLWGLLL